MDKTAMRCDKKESCGVVPRIELIIDNSELDVADDGLEERTDPLVSFANNPFWVTVLRSEDFT